MFAFEFAFDQLECTVQGPSADRKSTIWKKCWHWLQYYAVYAFNVGLRLLQWTGFLKICPGKSYVRVDNSTYSVQ